MAHKSGPGSACEAALRAWAARHPLPVTALHHPWAVAYSGGADSTALLLAAHTLWPGRVQAFHVHHGLQAAADSFVAHAGQICTALGVPLHVDRVQAVNSPGQSPEDAARQARYAALARMAHAHGAACVLLGQHAQDQMETVLLALTRGGGVAGLAGMPEEMNRHGVRFGRPLLQTDGRVLREQLDARGVPYLNDPTNVDERYTRNRIRARVLPPLLEAFPTSLETFARSARLAAQASRVLQDVAWQDLQTVGAPPVIRRLQALSRERQANALRHWLQEGWQAVPSEAQLNELLDQVAACTTRGHRLRLKVAAGYVVREGQALHYSP
jgi:tRNA(Ile)-lysidine synthase